ncbi:MAG TPA: hypothetical protein VHV49_14345 [Pseudonocardiaceae bacterium]|nr:hypothetical protein [Pseudonocardiaceae bacterium]
MRFSWELRPADGGGGTPPAVVSYRARRMSRIIASMAALGMVVDSGPAPKFPLWAVYGVSDFDSVGRPLGRRAGDYEAALAAILSHHGSTPEPGIPLHKLRTGLGWHVTSAECAAAVARFDARPDDQPGPLATRVVPFLRAAAAGDGFEVH